MQQLDLPARARFEASRHEARRRSALADEIARLDRQFAEIERANEPSVLPEGGFERLVDIAATAFTDVDGSERPLLRPEEGRLLSLRKGSLSDSRIPAIALSHHEKLNGTGYPHKLAAPEIPVQTRMMTIADIFDALSAADRPYKKAVPIERALDILGEAVKDGELDADLFELFVGARVR